MNGAETSNSNSDQSRPLAPGAAEVDPRLHTRALLPKTMISSSIFASFVATYTIVLLYSRHSNAAWHALEFHNWRRWCVLVGFPLFTLLLFCVSRPHNLQQKPPRKVTIIALRVLSIHQAVMALALSISIAEGTSMSAIVPSEYDLLSAWAFVVWLWFMAAISYLAADNGARMRRDAAGLSHPPASLGM